jgi:hypothetical protein
MSWARSNIKCVSRIALFALMIQFALSFGHFHAIAFAGGLAAQAADTQSARQPASNHHSDEHPGDICAICAVTAMANAALFATPPALPLPQSIAFSHRATDGEFARVAAASVAFQPRAPPIS